MSLGMHVSLEPGQEGLFFLSKKGLECARVQRRSKLGHSAWREMNHISVSLSGVCLDLNPISLLSSYSVPGVMLCFMDVS